jgi:glucose/arabinose dehydrogenase
MLTVLPALAGAIALAAAAPASAQAPQASQFEVVSVVEGLQEAWSIAFLPNGDLLVTEKPGRLRLVRNGVLQPQPIAGTPQVRFGGQGGLLDVVLHPQFASNQLVYLSFSKGNADGSEGTTAVVRGKLQGNSLVDVQEIFLASNAWSTTRGHYGSRLAFDRDGYLFITVGDRQAPPTGNLEAHPAQDLTKFQGKVHRIHDDGRIPADNPFVNTPGAVPSIWTYGHRSPQGLFIHPVSGQMYQSEHGPQGGDELNLILKGRNYGWPVIGYGVNYGGAKLHSAREREGMEQPLWYFTPSIATSGLLVYTGDLFPDWKNNVFLGGRVSRSLSRAPLVGDDLTTIGRMNTPLLQGIGEFRDIRQGPDGSIYLIVEDRRGDGLSDVLKLVPSAQQSSSR